MLASQRRHLATLPGALAVATMLASLLPPVVRAGEERARNVSRIVTVGGDRAAAAAAAGGASSASGADQQPGLRQYAELMSYGAAFYPYYGSAPSGQGPGAILQRPEPPGPPLPPLPPRPPGPPGPSGPPGPPAPPGPGASSFPYQTYSPHHSRPHYSGPPVEVLASDHAETEPGLKWWLAALFRALIGALGADFVVKVPALLVKLLLKKAVLAPAAVFAALLPKLLPVLASYLVSSSSSSDGGGYGIGGLFGGVGGVGVGVTNATFVTIGNTTIPLVTIGNATFPLVIRNATTTGTVTIANGTVTFTNGTLPVGTTVISLGRRRLRRPGPGSPPPPTRAPEGDAAQIPSTPLMRRRRPWR